MGSEILVNTATASDQFSADHGAVERRLRGDVAGQQPGRWRRDGGQQQPAVKAQVFAADGTPVGSEILVNTATASNQVTPQITALSNGGFVVTWEDYSHGRRRRDGGQQQRRREGAGVRGGRRAVGSEILVNTATANDQVTPQITALSNGGFVVTWRTTAKALAARPGTAATLP